jgi:glycosyltransferase involved in cell wall biosynthesis
MKVLVLSEHSGSSRYWSAALPELRRRGIDVAYGTVHPEGDIHRELTDQGFEVRSLGARSSKDYPAAILRLAKIQRTDGYDIIHASEPLPALIAGAARRLGSKKARVLYHYHHTVVGGKQRIISRFAARLSDRVMAVSRASRDAAIAQDGVAEQKVSIAHNGIAPLRKVTADEVTALRRQLGVGDGDVLLVLVARLREEKGHLTAISAVTTLASLVERRVHLAFVGTGDYENVIREAVTEDERLTVHFAGHQDDVALWFASADVNLMPSYAEPFGLVAVEAMSSGRPLVASAVDGLLEIVEDGVSGLLVPPHDSDALAAAIKRTLNDRQLATHLASGGAERVATAFTIEKMVGGWVDCYNLLLK